MQLYFKKIIFKQILSFKAGIFPYPSDCSKFRQCTNSGCFVMSCGAGTEFNPSIKACDYKKAIRVDCRRH